MKRFTIPLLERDVYFYVGDKEFPSWKKAVIKAGCRDAEMLAHKNGSDAVGESGGMTYGGWIWVHSLKNKNTLFHEVQHVIFNIQLSIGIEDENEFSAYIAGWFNEKVFNWIMDEEAKERIANKKTKK